MFGKYRILSTLGAGSNGTVYLAEHTILNTYRAIKCIPKNTTPVVSSVSEAKLLKNLHHPGIPFIFDVEEDEHSFFIIEEFVQGESLDNFLSHQSISHELLLKFGIQLCDILDYLHHFLPYPILYQDLKPEHIIVCAEQIKLIDFGAASFFTGSGETYQIYGTKMFASPEALAGLPVSPRADIFSLGKVLEYIDARNPGGHFKHFQQTIKKATAVRAEDRYETIALFRAELEKDLTAACPTVSHLTKEITVIGSKSGIGTTHIAISLVCAFNKKNYPAIYLEEHETDCLHSMIRKNLFVKEQNGICYHNNFCGIPNYGQSILCPTPKDHILVKDCGVYQNNPAFLNTESEYLFILSGSLWDLERDISAGKQLLSLEHITFLCNYDNRSAAKKLASALGQKVFCFPFDSDAFVCTPKKQQLFSQLFSLERRKKKFLSLNKRLL